VERLGQEALDAAGAADGEFILVGELVHTQNRDDVLQFLVLLKDLLHLAGHGVVLHAQDQGVQNARSGVQRVHSGVDAQLGDLTGKHQGAVQVRERRGRGGVGQVVGGHVNGLHGSDRTLVRGGDALLQFAEVGAQGGLVTNRGRHTAEQSGHFRTRLGEAEDVVNEQQHVLAVGIAEVLGDGQTGEGHAGTGSRRLVHLTVHQGGLVQNAGFLEFVVEVVTLAGALTHAGEDRQTAMVLGDVVDHLHENNGLAHAGAAEQAHLAALGEGDQEVHDLDAGFEHFNLGVLIHEGGSAAVNAQAFVAFDGAHFVNGTTHDVDDAAQSADADRHLNGLAGVRDLHAAHQTIGGVHGDRTHHVVAEVLCDLADEILGIRIIRIHDLKSA